MASGNHYYGKWPDQQQPGGLNACFSSINRRTADAETIGSSTGSIKRSTPGGGGYGRPRNMYGLRVVAEGAKPPLLILEAPGSSLKSPESLLERPFDGSAGLVAIGQIVVQGRKAMLLAVALDLSQLSLLESRFPDTTPVAGCRVHRETGCQCSVSPDDQRVLSGAAIPLRELAPHEPLHFLKAPDRIHHFVAGPVFLDEPVDEGIDTRPVRRRDERAVAVVVSEMRLVEHRGFVDVVVGGDAVLVGDLS